MILISGTLEGSEFRGATAWMQSPASSVNPVSQEVHEVFEVQAKQPAGQLKHWSEER